MAIIDGKQLAASLKASVREQVLALPERYGRLPKLTVIIVGENPASKIYVRNKAKACEEVGILNETLTFPETLTEDELLQRIDELNADDSVDGILVQLPLPRNIDERKVIAAISKDKDVDGFHPLNVAALWQKMPCVVACTPKGILKMLESVGVNPCGKRAVVMGRSNIVGLPVTKLLMDANATVTVCHTKTNNLRDITKQAEILVVATGQPKVVTGDMVSDGVVVIDVGMDRDPQTGRLCGDVDFDSVAPKASYISPVPGGVGPMTIACLMENTLECFLRRQNR